MSTAKDRAEKLRARDQAASAIPEDQPEGVPTRHPPAKVRQTVDLTLDQHNELASWRINAAASLGRARLTNQDVLATLVALLLADDNVARRVRARLEESQ